MATVDVDILQIDTSKSQQSVAGLKSEIKALKDQLLNLKIGTKEYNDVLGELGTKTHTLNETMYRINEASTDFSNNVSNLRGTLTGAAGAFQTVIGSLSLMGVNIGDDVKMMKMLQSAMAITQGIQAIQSGVTAFKRLATGIKMATAATHGLKAAIISTGIGALVVLIGTLVSSLSQLGKASEATSQKITGAWNNIKASIENTERAFNRALKKMKADGMSETEAIKAQIAQIDKEMSRYQDRLVILAGHYSIASKEEKKEIEQQMQELQKMQADYGNRRLDLLVDLEIAEQKEIEEQEKQKTEIYKKAAEERQADLAKIAAANRGAEIGLMSDEEGELAKLEDAFNEQVKLFEKRGQDTTTITEYYEKQRAGIIAMYAQQRADAEQAHVTEQHDTAELQAEAEYYQQQAEIIIANRATVNEELLQLEIDFNCQQQELLRQRYEDNLLSTDDFNSQMASLEVEAANLQIEQEKQVTDKTKAELEKRKKIHQNYQKATSSIVGSICDILGSIGSTLEQGTAEWKALMTAQAVISTIKGGIDAYMGMVASIPGPIGIAAGVAAAAATVVAGMAEVAKIQSTEVSTTSSASTSKETSLGSVNEAAVSMLSTQVTNTRQIATEDDIAELPETKVYVLESEITASQNNVKATVKNSTY